MTAYMPIILDTLLILLALAGVVTLVYLTIVLARINNLLGRIEVLIGYASHIQSMLESWEAFPKTVFNWVLEMIPERSARTKK